MKAIQILETVMEFDDDPKTKQDYQDAISELKDLESYIEERIKTYISIEQFIASTALEAVLEKIRGEK